MFTDTIKKANAKYVERNTLGTPVGDKNATIFGSMFESVILESEKIDPNMPDKNGLIANIEKAFGDDEIGKKVCYMVANSHEYKDKPNVKGALAFTKNYKWKEGTSRLSKMQGINKPIIKEKVLDMATNMKGKEELDTEHPLVVVDKLHNVTPQSPGSKILFDGHHRKEAKEFLNHKFASVYDGHYTGNAEKSTDELIGYDEPDEVESLEEATQETIPLTAEEKIEVDKKYGKYECIFAKNSKNGKYFCYARTRSKYYDSPTDIPKSEVNFVSSTS